MRTNDLKYLITVISLTCFLLTEANSTEELASNIPYPEMVLLAGGKFEMGSLVSYKAQPIHDVSIEPFYISKYEITYNEYDAFTEAVGNSKRHDLDWGRGQNPVVDVSWKDATEYANWLSEVSGETYRLPTEAEWEYAAKANNRLSQYAWGDEVGTNNANCRDCGSQFDGRMTAPIGSFEPNSFGLFDMLGNVWELTSNCYTETYHEAPTYRIEDSDSQCKVITVRGGSWDTNSSEIKVWHRASIVESRTYRDVGFRLVKEVD